MHKGEGEPGYVPGEERGVTDRLCGKLYLIQVYHR